MIAGLDVCTVPKHSQGREPQRPRAQVYRTLLHLAQASSDSPRPVRSPIKASGIESVQSRYQVTNNTYPATRRFAVVLEVCLGMLIPSGLGASTWRSTSPESGPGSTPWEV